MGKISIPNLKLLFVLVLISASLVSQGCSTLNTSGSPTEEWTPPAWEKSTKAPDKVWQLIKSGEVDSMDAFSLVECIDIAFTNSPTTREAWANAKAAQTRIKQAESEWYPQASGLAKTQFQKRVTNNSAGDANQSDNTISGEVQMLILDLGGRASRVTEAKQALIAANYDYNQSLQDLLRDVEIAYYDYYSSQANVEAAQSSVDDAKMSLDSAEQKLAAGLGVKLDVLQTRADYDSSLYSLEDAKGIEKKAKANLSKVMGFSADYKFEIDFPVEKLPTEISKEDVSMLIDKALSARPDVASMRASMRSKEAALGAANSDLWPTVNLGGTADSNKHNYFGSEKNDMLFNSKTEYGYTGYISVNWTIFDGFNLYSKRNEAKAQRDAEREKLRQAEIEASADVWTKFYQYNTEIMKLQFSKASFQSSNEAYDLAFEGYNAGLKNILDLLSAQSQLSNARSAVIRSRRDLFSAIVELAHSMGEMHVRQEIAQGTSQ